MSDVDPIDREAVTLPGAGAIPAISVQQAKAIRDEAVDAERAEAQRVLFELGRLVETARGAYEALRKYKLPAVTKTSGPGEASPAPEEEGDSGEAPGDGAVDGASVDLGTGGATPATSPAASALANLIDLEWIASCVAQTGDDPGMSAVRAMADPLNADIVWEFFGELAGEGS